MFDLKGLFSFFVLVCGLQGTQAEAAQVAPSLLGFAPGSVSDYQTTFAECISRGQGFIVIRKFNLDKTPTVLAVDPLNLRTLLLPQQGLQCRSTLSSSFAQTKYGQVLGRGRSLDRVPWDAGLQNSNMSSHVFLTVDLCPSRKPFEAHFFDLVKEKQLPVALSVSGGWIEHHPDELQALKNLRSAGVDVTWVNHSLTHPYVKSLNEYQNFFLLPGVDERREILGNEQKMIEHGLVPSIFFRFPGLISDQAIADQALAWGLIPLGADAWLALGKQPHPGSIILVHGNGNEPYGIRLFFQDLPELLQMGFASLNRLPSR